VLANYAGTILLVSHDRYFVDALATQVWALEDGQIHVTKGGYGAYLAGRESRLAEKDVRAVAAREMETAGRSRRERAPADSGNGRRKGEYRRQLALAEVESAIHATESQLADLARRLEEASQAQAVEQVRQLGEDYQRVEEEMESLFSQWAALEAN